MNNMTRISLKETLNSQNLVFLLGFTFCLLWCGRTDNFIFTIVLSLLSVMIMVIVSLVPVKMFKVMTPIMFGISFVMAIFALFLQEDVVTDNRWLHFANMSIDVPALLALSYALVVSFLASLPVSLSTAQNKDIVYLKLSFGTIVFFLIIIFNLGLGVVMLIGALAGIIASGFIKHKASLIVAISLSLFALIFFVGASIVVADKVLNDSSKTVNVEMKETPVFNKRIGVWSDKITSLVSHKDDNEVKSNQDRIPTSYARPSYFYYLFNSFGKWAYIIPLLMLGYMARITTKGLKYSDVVYRKVLGNTMAYCLLTMVVADLILPLGNTVRNSSICIIAFMIGAIVSCLKSAKIESEKLYSTKASQYEK